LEQPQVLIVGSGPAGHTAAIYAARAGLEPVVVAGSVTAGGALVNTTDVENFPGFPEGIAGPDLMEAMTAQARKFGAQVLYDDAVEFDLAGPIKQVVTGAGAALAAPAVILATGSAYRSLGLEEERRLTGRGVSYCATCDAAFFREKEVLVIGGGDSALEEATFLARFASRVTVVHRRGELRASKVMVERAMAEPKIGFEWHATVAEILGQGSVTGARLADTRDGAARELEADGIFVAIGHTPRTELLAGQVELDRQGYIVVDHPSSRTSVAGVFAAGDAVDHTYRQAITAAASGCKAALDAQDYLEDLRTASALAAATM
jgi:thioredoxin reductase (NADPH)